MEQLIAHLFGDYIMQSHWMAINKRTNTLAAFIHATIYSVPFYWLGSGRSLLVIWSTHLLIDRFGLARYIVWAKNWMGEWRRESMTAALDRAKLEGRVTGDHVFGPGELEEFLDEYRRNPKTILPNLPWSDCSATGYTPDVPAWLSVWLLIAADNTLHLTINYAAIRWIN